MTVVNVLVGVALLCCPNVVLYTLANPLDSFAGAFARSDIPIHEAECSLQAVEELEIVRLGFFVKRG
jgi:hypothetical protein